MRLPWVYQPRDAESVLYPVGVALAPTLLRGVPAPRCWYAARYYYALTIRSAVLAQVYRPGWGWLSVRPEQL